MRIFNGKLLGTTDNGSLSGNITNLNCMCHEVSVKPAHETTIYDINIVNPDGAVVFETTAITGTLAELTALPLYGTYTINIVNATADEYFIISLVSRED